jgi:hypothetical protein
MTESQNDKVTISKMKLCDLPDDVIYYISKFLDDIFDLFHFSHVDKRNYYFLENVIKERVEDFKVANSNKTIYNIREKDYVLKIINNNLFLDISMVKKFLNDFYEDYIIELFNINSSKKSEKDMFICEVCKFDQVFLMRYHEGYLILIYNPINNVIKTSSFSLFNDQNYFSLVKYKLKSKLKILYEQDKTFVIKLENNDIVYPDFDLYSHKILDKNTISNSSPLIEEDVTEKIKKESGFDFYNLKIYNSIDIDVKHLIYINDKYMIDLGTITLNHWNVWIFIVSSVGSKTDRIFAKEAFVDPQGQGLITDNNMKILSDFCDKRFL